MDLYFSDHLCFFWTLGRINNHIAEKVIYFEKGPAIILKGVCVWQGRIIWGGGGARGPGPLFLLDKNFFESYIYLYDKTYSSYIDLNCLFCICVTVKIQFDNTST